MKCDRSRPQHYFDELTGKRYWSVSEVRKVAYDSYAGIPESVLEPARVRGTILHRRFFFAMASLEGLCPYPVVIPQYEGYCQSMDRWIEKRKPTRIKLESSSCCPRYGYAGTPDALLEFGMPVSRKKMAPRLVLMDLKTGDPTRTDAMQLVSYSHMDEYGANELLDVYLDADGGEAKEQFVTKGQRGTEWAAFLNALSLLRWRDSL